MTTPTPVISCLMSLLSSEQKIPRVPRGPGSQSCGHVPVQVTKNRPVRLDTAYPGLLEPGHSLLQENPSSVLYRKEIYYSKSLSPPHH